jgi:hypothetical protein
MVATNTRATGPLTSRLHRDQAKGNWVVARVDLNFASGEVILGGFSCDCNGRTLVQINRTADIDTGVQLGVTCHRDGNRVYRPYRRMPWMVEEYMLHREEWRCDSCSEVVGNLQMMDGVIVGVDLNCPICRTAHAIDLSMGALPQELRHSAFGVEAPQPLLSPPVYDVLRMMWECIQRKPSNNFTYQPHTMRHDTGRVHHAASGIEFETVADHLTQLAAAKLIEDGDTVSISKSGVIVCLRQFGGAVA